MHWTGHSWNINNTFWWTNYVKKKKKKFEITASLSLLQFLVIYWPTYAPTWCQWWAYIGSKLHKTLHLLFYMSKSIYFSWGERFILWKQIYNVLYGSGVHLFLSLRKTTGLSQLGLRKLTPVLQLRALIMNDYEEMLSCCTIGSETRE